MDGFEFRDRLAPIRSLVGDRQQRREPGSPPGRGAPPNPPPSRPPKLKPPHQHPPPHPPRRLSYTFAFLNGLSPRSESCSSRARTCRSTISRSSAPTRRPIRPRCSTAPPGGLFDSPWLSAAQLSP